MNFRRIFVQLGEHVAYDFAVRLGDLRVELRGLMVHGYECD